MAAEDIKKAAVTTPFGLYEFLEMPPGLKNGSKSIQQVKNHLYQKFGFLCSYQDDDLVLLETHEEHLEHFNQLFTALQDAKLEINCSKCQIGLPQVVFAGYLVSEKGFQPPAPKIQAIVDFSKPKDSSQLHRFIGMTNCYCRCIPHASELQAPLTDMLKGAIKKKAILT